MSFRKQKKVLPGIYLNFSKDGISTTVGPRATNINFGKGGGTGFKNAGNSIKSERSKTVAIILAFFLGTFGIHRFYLRQYWWGIPYVLFFPTWIPTIISLIEAIIFALMPQVKFDNKYNNTSQNTLKKSSNKKKCASCDETLKFTNTPFFGFGKLSDGSRMCYKCISGTRTTSEIIESYKRRYQLVNNSISTSKSLEELKKHIEASIQERKELETEIRKQQFATKRLEKNLQRRLNGIGKLFAKQAIIEKLQEELKDANLYLTDLYSQYENSQANINIESDKEIQKQYENVKETYTYLLKSEKIWDVISEAAYSRSANETSIDRKEARFTLNDLDFILSEYSAFHLENTEGDNLYIFPAFILRLSDSGEITIIDLHELNFHFNRQCFLEEKSGIPNDAKIVDYTVAKMNNSGLLKKIAGNSPIPIVEYGSFEFSTNSGLKKTYYISNVQLAERFANEFRKYIALLTPATNFSIAETTTGSNKTKTNEFSYQFYSLLKDFSGSLFQIVRKLQTNEAILERINAEKLQKTASDEFLVNCVMYDMIQISNILAEENLSTHSLEATGLVLAVNQFLPNSRENILNKEFNTLALAHKEGFYQDIARQLFEVAAMENPMQITLQDKQKEHTILSPQQKSLSLPAFLKISDNPLFDEYVTALYRYATIISKADNTVSKKEEILLKKIYQLTHYPIPEIKNESLHISKGDNNESLEKVLDELNSLIGLNEVKAEINTLINFIKVQKAREGQGLKSSSVSYHIVFTGNPGTGKTTVARIVAKIYKHLGILTQGQLVETDRSGLVAEYLGQTAIKVNKTVNSALNGVLFIDEAYALVGKNKDDFGKEAVATLIKRMEDDRDKLALILAGYTNEMTEFIDTNPGFKSRFNRYINFPDYTPDELLKMIESNCNKLEYQLTEEAKIKLKSIFESAYATRDKSFGNGRFVRNIFEKTLEQQANRIAKEANLTKEILTTITEDDITRVSPS